MSSEVHSWLESKATGEMKESSFLEMQPLVEFSKLLSLCYGGRNNDFFATPTDLVAIIIMGDKLFLNFGTKFTR